MKENDSSNGNTVRMDCSVSYSVVSAAENRSTPAGTNQQQASQYNSKMTRFGQNYTLSYRI